MKARIAMVGCLLVGSVVGCASRCQVTNCVFKPLQANGGLGRVAVFSVVSAKTERSYHTKEAKRVREAIKSSLEEIGGTKVVKSEPLAPQYYGKGVANYRANFLEDACSKAQLAGADAVCLVQFKDPGGSLSLGLPQLATVSGTCDYDIRLVDLRSGQELFASSGSWSDRVDLPKMRFLPDTAQLGAGIAQTLQPSSGGHTEDLKYTASLLSNRQSSAKKENTQ